MLLAQNPTRPAKRRRGVVRPLYGPLLALTMAAGAAVVDLTAIVGKSAAQEHRDVVVETAALVGGADGQREVQIGGQAQAGPLGWDAAHAGSVGATGGADSRK